MENRGPERFNASVGICIGYVKLFNFISDYLFAWIHVHDYRCVGLTAVEVQTGHYGGEKLDASLLFAIFPVQKKQRRLPWVDFKISLHPISFDLVSLERLV